MGGLPAWAQSLPTHLRAEEIDGRTAVRYVHTGGVFWDSGCVPCQERTAVIQLMPNHEASASCRSGGRAHCSCDTCF